MNNPNLDIVFDDASKASGAGEAAVPVVEVEPETENVPAVAEGARLDIDGLNKRNAVLPAWFYEADPGEGEPRVRKDALRTMLIMVWNEAKGPKGLKVKLDAVKELIRLEGYGGPLVKKDKEMVKMSIDFAGMQETK